jgi:CRISPR-associated protein Cas1
MKKLLNTLYVSTQGAYLYHEGEAIVVRLENEEKLRVPIHLINGLVCFGNVAISSSLLGLCGERGVAVSLLTEHGRFLARVQTQVSGNVLLRRKQYRLADQAADRVDLARGFVLGKLANARTVLQRASRDHGDKGGVEALVQASNQLSYLIEAARQEPDIDALRGIEGRGARAYFEVFDHMITTQKDTFFLYCRSRRPPLDNLNALLSFIYTLVVHDAEAALEAVGLDPQVGYLHAERPGRPSLALDLIEEFRPVFADRLALSLVNLRQVQPDGFKTSESGGIIMDDETRKVVLVNYQKRKEDEITHRFLEEVVPIGLLLHVQALLLSRFIRGDLDAYPPFLWK